MKKWQALLLFAGLSLTARATHITGGEMYYTYVGVVNGMHQYNVTLKLYQRCNSGRQFPNPTIISIFDRTNNQRYVDMSVAISNEDNISITNPDPCISNPPNVCYDIAYYRFVVSLPPTQAGYVLASQVNFRINGISNLQGGQVGATYTAEIPGTNGLATPYVNNSAQFTGSDLVIVCAENDFSYSFGAEDADGDELRYSFCDAYTSTNSAGGASPTGPPPFPAVPYFNPNYSGSAPLGANVQVHPATGMITGVAPPGGMYVVTVCVQEVRQGIVIATQRKDVQINVADCNIAAASLLPEYLLCKNTQTITVSNLSISPLISTYNWEMIDRTGMVIASASTPTITYTFPDTGLYTVKLVINRNQPCTDSISSPVRVYPGFVPGFTSTGICVTKPTFFTDQSTSVYGIVNSWSWEFGEPTVSSDVSSIQNPVYTYPAIGSKNAVLIVTDTKGCRDTITRTIDIIEKPPITLAFRDTLICINDNLQLQASGMGIFSWSPAVNIINANTATPTVSPPVTTWYYVDLDENGCRNRDSVRVRVVNFVTVQPMNDTTICSGDTIRLRVVSDGLRFTWLPAQQLLDPAVQNPFAVTPATTNYQVTATIGGCSETRTIRVTTIPYPLANAGEDTTICYNTTARLSGVTNGTSWQWAPASLVSNPTSLSPLTQPAQTTSFIFSAYDTRGCPKPGHDTVLVTVLPEMGVSAGSDTAVVADQPLQLHATGGETYLWSPALYLSSPTIADPVGLFSETAGTILYKVVGFNMAGCRDSAYVSVKVFATAPTIFVPSAFTPNNDGKNDVLRPIAVGMKQITSFQVFNRWGQPVFSTTINGHGWDGRVAGQAQGSNTYVWFAKAVDYLGKTYFNRGVVTLIR
jgi:gliding motility-associated-like protein